MDTRGLTFIYVEYGDLERLFLELRYSLTTLLYLQFQRPVEVVVYTDKPSRYLDLPVRIVDISKKITEFSRNGLYHHRIKPCVLLEEMRNNPNFCVMIDTDTFFQEGFFEKLWSALSEGSIAVDRFHGRNPFRAISGFRTNLPNAGPYEYDTKRSVEYNSGLTAVDPARHIPVLKDAIALIDAMLDHGARLLTIEQIALSECLRIHGISVATMYPVFRHYYRVAHKRYMQSQLRCWAAGQRTGFEPQPPTIQYSRFRVRYFRIAARLTAMIGKDVEAQMRWR